MRAVLVCVDYSDFLSITLPYNRHHFEDVMVVTSMTDQDTVQVAFANNCKVFRTNAFYEQGAVFNKWKALEQGLDFYGREGWLVIMDADIMWPRALPNDFNPTVGSLYTPRRRMMFDLTKPIPPEPEWTKFDLHPQSREWAGFTQIFHCNDPVLGNPPWHQTDWKHAGGADSFFQRKWPKDKKIRPPFEVLHLGQTGQNWCGRSTPYLSGEVPAQATMRKQLLHNFLLGRRGQSPADRYKHERL